MACSDKHNDQVHVSRPVKGAHVRRRLGLAVACVLAFVATLAGSSQARDETAQQPCADVFRQTLWAAAPLAGPGSDVDPWIRRAMTQFRFHRRDDALTKLTSVDTRLRGAFGRQLPDEKKSALVTSLGELRECFVRSEPPPLATATIQVFVGASASQVHGPPAGRGVLVLVGDIIAGRTTNDGTLTLRVPSGPIDVRAEVHGDSGAAGAAEMDLPPGASGKIAVVLGEGQHPAYQTELILLEAVDDAVPASSGSFTLQFRESDAAVPIARVVDVGRLDADFREQEFLTEQFRAAGGRIVARNAPDLLRTVPKDGWMYLSVTGRDATGVHRSNVIRLRVTDAGGGRGETRLFR